MPRTWNRLLVHVSLRCLFTGTRGPGGLLGAAMAWQQSVVTQTLVLLTVAADTACAFFWLAR